MNVETTHEIRNFLCFGMPAAEDETWKKIVTDLPSLSGLVVSPIAPERTQEEHC